MRDTHTHAHTPKKLNRNIRKKVEKTQKKEGGTGKKERRKKERTKRKRGKRRKK